MATATEHPPTSYPGVDRERFRRRGYTVVKRLFAPAEIETLREQTVSALDKLETQDLLVTETGSEGTARYSRCDVLSIPEVRHMLLDRRVVGVVGELLGDRPAYFGESVLRTGAIGARGWHRDCVNRRKFRGGLDWYDPYRILRCGVYMQDQAHHTGGLALRPRSNRPGFQIRSLPLLVDAEVGDLVVWDLRTIHSGEAVRVRGLPDLTLHPRLQTLLPQALRVGEARERMVLFMSFGLRGPHLDHYLDYLQTRKQNREIWATSRFGADVWEQATEAGLDVVATTPEYGTPRVD
jgi:Phytanoyl-CoA dioxygenase (PhyH)